MFWFFRRSCWSDPKEEFSMQLQNTTEMKKKTTNADGNVCVNVVR